MPLPFLMGEGQHMDHSGNLIWPIYVDFRNTVDRHPISTLIKGCRARYAMETIEQLRISKPSRFRDFGENLIRDPDEARPWRDRVIQEYINDPSDLERAKQRDQAMNRAAELVGATWKTGTTSVRRTYSEGQSLSTMTNCWIFCTSMEPSTDQEWKEWRSTLDDEYDHTSYIYEPRAFARELGSIVADRLGPQCQLAQLTHSFEGLPTLLTEHPAQAIYHGPVIYVDDAYRLVETATSKVEFTLLPLFAKDKEYQAQREYRFVVVAETEPTEFHEDLPISPKMKSIVGSKKRDMPPQWTLEPEVTQGDLGPEKGDMTRQKGSIPTIAGESSLGLGRNLIRELEEANSLENELFRNATRPKKPETVYRPHEVAHDELPDDFQTVTAIYSSVQALRSKVRDFLKLDEESSEQKLAVTSAAWHAEQDLREICSTFDDPISGISVSEDGFIVIHVSLPGRPGCDCKLAVAPSGDSVMHLVAPRGQTTQKREQILRGMNIGQEIRDIVDKLLGSNPTPL